MSRIFLLATLTALALAGCNAQSGSESRQTAQSQTDRASSDAGKPGPAALPSMIPPVTGVNDGEPDLTPPRLSPEAERGEKGARNLLLAWARAIELKEFDQAWSMAGESDERRLSKAEFAEIFTGLEDIAVSIPDGVMEGAAGSLYYSGRVTISAENAEGRPIRVEGPVVLRRANDVPGATPEQLRWHFHSADLRVTH